MSKKTENYHLLKTACNSPPFYYFETDVMLSGALKGHGNYLLA